MKFEQDVSKLLETTFCCKECGWRCEVLKITLGHLDAVANGNCPECRAEGSIRELVDLGVPADLMAKTVSEIRAAGYFPKLEAQLASRWECQNCGELTPFAELEVNPQTDALSCPHCRKADLRSMPASTPELSVVKGGRSC